jgi:two-component system sensor histidine kinase RegB
LDAVPHRAASRRAIDVAERLGSSEIALSWLVRLRWHSVGAQVLAVGVALASGVLAPPALYLWGSVGLLGVTNVGLQRWARAGRGVTQSGLALVLLTDTALLTLVLGLAGGAENPLVALYVVHVTLAALLLGKRGLATLVLATIAGHAALVFLPVVPLRVALPPSANLAALALITVVNGALVARVVGAFRERQRALARAHAEAARAEKLASLATLAAGAAHELSTPLGTIAVSASELLALIEAAPAQAADEARWIRREVERCKRILLRMGARAEGTVGELPRRVRVAELFECVRRELGASAQRLETEGDGELEFDAPLESLAAVLTNLLTNGLQASPPSGRVTLSVSESAGTLCCTVSDRGAGIAAALLPRLGEPFFTTKAAGEGMGLGLFLAFQFCKACQGRLGIESVEGVGTRARLELPRFGSVT